MDCALLLTNHFRAIGNGIVAVGDSITYGSEVGGSESWPALLEGLLGRPVLNGGVSGWGTDQILLRREQFLDLFKPEILIIGFLAADIERTGLSVFSGAAKPYFKIEGGVLVRHNDPVPLPSDTRANLPWYQKAFRNSNMFRHAIRPFPTIRTAYYGGRRSERVDNDTVAVTCKLLDRVKAKADRRNTRVILVMQYGGYIIRDDDSSHLHAQAVMDCARGIQLQVVDEFPSLRAVALQGSEVLESYFVMHGQGWAFGHMSAEGNRHVAELVTKAIERPSDGLAAETDDFALVDRARRLNLDRGQSLLDETDELEDQTALASSELTAEPGPGPGKVHRLVGSGGRTEHYLSTGLLASEPGDHAFSAWLDPSNTRIAVLQIKDRDGHGGLVSVDLAKSSVVLRRMENSDVHAWIDERRDGWTRVAIRARTKQDAVSGILQLVGRNWSRTSRPAVRLSAFSECDWSARQIQNPEDTKSEMRPKLPGGCALLRHAAQWLPRGLLRMPSTR